MRIYASDVQRLIDDPYDFYLRKILNARPVTMLHPYDANVIGMLVHSAIHMHTDTCEDSISIVESCMKEMNIPSYAHELIFNLVHSMLLSYCDYAISSCKPLEVFSEVYGESYCTDLLYRNQQLKIDICAIADRIEIHSNKIRIIDFKTGTAPSKKDVLSFKAPQLLVEAVILSNGHFDKIDNINNKSIEIVYLKLAANKSCEETVIELSQKDIESYKQQLQELIHTTIPDMPL